jgi:hypothetical protein
MSAERTNLNKTTPKPEGSPPDSTEPHGICPRCSRHSNFTHQGDAPLTYTSGYWQDMNGRAQRTHDQRLSILECQGCRDNVLVVEDEYVGGVARRKGGKSGTVEWRGIHWWPTPGGAPQDLSVPVDVADAIAEGERCLAVQAPRAAVVMFRSALALLVQDKGSPTSQGKANLAGQLTQMADDGDLDRTLAEWAHQVRVVGNMGAHPGGVDGVSPAEAADLSRLLAALVQYLYVMPAQVSRARNQQ